MRMAQHVSVGAVFCGLLCLAASGCVERVLYLRSDPPGAKVVVNGRPVGETPLAMPFETYGVFEVVAHDVHGYRRLRTSVEAKPPWYERIPIDFFAENVWPFTIRDRHEVLLTLEPAAALTPEEIDAGEAALRDRLHDGAAPAE